MEDTARTLSGYADAIVIRTFAQATVEQIADAANAPVINALTDEHHPCQALADLLTLRERFGGLNGLQGGVRRRLRQRRHLAGRGRRAVRDRVRASAARRVREGRAGATVVSDPAEAVRGAHAVYTDVWVSMGEEAEAAQRLRDLAPVPGERGADGARPRTRSSCTACRPTAARRWPPR